MRDENWNRERHADGAGGDSPGDRDEAVSRSRQDRPDLILMDLIMPVMDGVEATRRIMADSACPILVVTASVDGNFGRVYEALGAGALDAVNTPALASPEGARILLSKIEVMRRLADIGKSESKPDQVESRMNGGKGKGDPWLYAIGSSAGGPDAVSRVLKALPGNTAASIVVIQHLDENFAGGLAQWLGEQCVLPVKLARDGQVPEPGVVLLPAHEDHLVLNAQGRLKYESEPKGCYYRPSVDVFFTSVVNHWKYHAAGVLLTGMGRDGAVGLKKMRDCGFTTFAQDQATSAVYGMPKAAADLGAASHILPLHKIAPALLRLNPQSPER